jgi:AraC family ethanolamine operon transcriptional activator
VVERTEAYVREHAGETIPVSELCRVLGLSERTLRNAFHDVTGLAPKRWLLAERLHGVRRALCNAGGTATTVTRAATEHGFFELGRFTRVYKEMFGEVPSVTLRLAISGQSGDAKPSQAENAHVCGS